MDAGFAIAGSALVLGTGGMLVGTHKAWLPQLQYAALWVLWQLVRPTFERSAAWWVEQHGVRPVARHAARLAWTDPAGRWRTVRYWARFVRWGAGRELAALGRWCARHVAAATDVRYGQLRLGGVA